MAKYFDPQLINGPAGDPGLYLDLAFERRALLFDAGELASVAPRKLLRIEHLFISHRHMDHFIGFDHLLRCLLGRDKTLHVWGPPGMIEGVESKLNAYSWDLIERYKANLVLHVSELSGDGRLTTSEFSGAQRFQRRDLPGSRWLEDSVLVDARYNVRAAMLQHSIPVLAFVVEESTRINIWRSRVEEMGLEIGPWLNSFKDAIIQGLDDDAPIAVVWADKSATHPRDLPLGQLKSEIMKETRGRKVGYVVDAAFTDANVKAIVALVEQADILFIEAPFLHKDVEQATARNHLTAMQAGLLGRWSKVGQLRTFHYSPRYRGREHLLADEAQSAFRGGSDLP